MRRVKTPNMHTLCNINKLAPQVQVAATTQASTSLPVLWGVMNFRLYAPSATLLPCQWLLQLQTCDGKKRHCKRFMIKRHLNMIIRCHICYRNPLLNHRIHCLSSFLSLHATALLHCLHSPYSVANATKKDQKLRQ